MKKLLTYSAILFGLGVFFSKAQNVYNNLSLGLKLLHLRILDVNPNTLTITFLSDIAITNTNGVPLYAPIHIKDIQFDINGVKVGKAIINKNNIYIGNNETVILKDVQLDLIFKDYNQLFATLKNIKTLQFNYNINYVIAGQPFNYQDNYKI